MDNEKEKKKRDNSIFAFCHGRLRSKLNISYLKGSYTIEAAIIVPCVFVLMVGIIFVSLYLRDVSFMKAAAVKCAFECESQETGREILKDKLSNGLMTMNLAKVVFNRSTDEAYVKVSCKYSIPFKYLRTIMEKVLGKPEIEIKQSSLDGRKDILKLSIWK